MGFILMYDITNEESFNAVQDWYVIDLQNLVVYVCVSKSKETTNPKASNCAFRATQIKTYSWDNAQVIMVGNKCDMDEERVVPPEKGKHLADQLGETLQPRTVNCFYLYPDVTVWSVVSCSEVFHQIHHIIMQYQVLHLVFLMNS